MEISVVIPLYRNVAILADLHQRLCTALGDRDFELIFVDDASPDDTLVALQAFSRTVLIANRFRLGDQRSILAGLAQAKGRVAVVISPLDDPAGIPALLKRLEKGDAQCVFASASGGLLSAIFAGLTGAPRNAGRYFAATRQMTDRLLAYRDHDPFVVPMIGCTGLPVVCIRGARSRSWARWRQAWRALRLVLRLKTR